MKQVIKQNPNKNEVINDIISDLRIYVRYLDKFDFDYLSENRNKFIKLAKNKDDIHALNYIKNLPNLKKQLLSTKQSLENFPSVNNAKSFLRENIKDCKEFIKRAKDFNLAYSYTHLTVYDSTLSFVKNEIIYGLSEYLKDLNKIKNPSLSECRKLLAEQDRETHKPTISHYRDMENGKNENSYNKKFIAYIKKMAKTPDDHYSRNFDDIKQKVAIEFLQKLNKSPKASASLKNPNDILTDSDKTKIRDNIISMLGKNLTKNIKTYLDNSKRKAETVKKQLYKQGTGTNAYHNILKVLAEINYSYKMLKEYGGKESDKMIRKNPKASASLKSPNAKTAYQKLQSTARMVKKYLNAGYTYAEIKNILAGKANIKEAIDFVKTEKRNGKISNPKKINEFLIKNIKINVQQAGKYFSGFVTYKNTLTEVTRTVNFTLSEHGYLQSSERDLPIEVENEIRKEWLKLASKIERYYGIKKGSKSSVLPNSLKTKTKSKANFTNETTAKGKAVNPSNALQLAYLKARKAYTQKPSIKTAQNFLTQIEKISNKGIREIKASFGYIDVLEDKRLVKSSLPAISINGKLKPKANFTNADYKKYLTDNAKQNAEMFLGKLSGNKRKILISDLTAKNGLSDMAKLHKLVCVRPNGEKVTIEFDGNSTLIMDNRRNLHFAGSDAKINNVRAAKNGGLDEIGKLTRIEYIAVKNHIESGKRVLYYHKAGEATRNNPVLCIDKNQMPYLVGGSYDVWDVGIVD